MIIFVMLVVIASVSVNLAEIKKQCNHDWELVSQKIYCFQYHKTYKCSKCGKRKFIEEEEK